MKIYSTPFYVFRLNPLFAVLLSVLFLHGLQAKAAEQSFPRNNDESKIPPYTLPDPLIAEDGTKIDSVKLWETKRRPEILNMVEENQFGRPPGEIDGFESKLISSDRVGNKLIEQVVLTLKKEDRSMNIDLMIVRPADAKGPVPAIVSINFKGNHTIITNTCVKMKDARAELIGRKPNLEKLPERGEFGYRYAVDDIIEHGWALVTYAREEIINDAMQPDYTHGVFKLLPFELDENGERKNPEAWGTMAAWSWSISRVIDYVETNPALDKKRIAVQGSSRLGIATAWAGATDQRIKVTIPNVAGKGGTSLLKRDFGINTLEVMLVKTQRYCDQFRTWSDKIDELPFDANLTLSLIAPRALYVSHAEEDFKADAKGAFLALKSATPVYELYGKQGMAADEVPEVDHPVFSHVGMHIRSGKHECRPYDWEQYLIFLDKYL